MTAQNTYKFKQAALRGQAHYQINGDAVSLLDDDGDTAWTVHFAYVTDATYAITTLKIGVSYTLVLKTKDASRRIYYTGPLDVTPDRDSYLALMAGIGAGLEAAQPGFRIIRGAFRSLQMGIFMAATFAMLLALGLIAAMAFAGLALKDVQGFALPVVALMAFGIWGMWSCRPNRAKKIILAKNFPSD